MLFKLGSKGYEVALIQNFLKSNGYRISVVDGDYGKETKSAVEKYQKNKGIFLTDGEVGDHTLSFMYKDGFKFETDRGAAVSSVLIKSFIKDLIASAEFYEGYIETDSNKEWDDPDIFGKQKVESDRLKRYMDKINWWEPGAAYCAAAVGAFVCMSLEKNKLSTEKFTNLWTAHVMTNVDYLLSKNLLSITPTIGSIWLARFGSTSSGHTGIVIDIHGDNLVTIEGNTSQGATLDPEKQRQGDGIYKRKFQKYGRGSLRTQGYLSAENLLKFFVS